MQINLDKLLYRIKNEFNGKVQIALEFDTNIVKFVVYWIDYYNKIHSAVISWTNKDLMNFTGDFQQILIENIYKVRRND